MDAFEKALSRVAVLPDAQKGLGAALLRLGRDDEAKSVLEKTLGTDQEDLSILAMLADVYRRSEEPAKAVALYERALALNPDDSRLLSALDEARKEEERLVSLERERHVTEETKHFWQRESHYRIRADTRRLLWRFARLSLLMLDIFPL